MMKVKDLKMMLEHADDEAFVEVAIDGMEFTCPAVGVKLDRPVIIVVKRG